MLYEEEDACHIRRRIHACYQDSTEDASYMRRRMHVI